MTQRMHEGTPQQLAAWLRQLPKEKRYRVVVDERESEAPRADESVDAQLRHWQEQENIPLMPDIPTRILFTQWAQEDAQMTDAERDAEDRLWEDVQKGINETRATLGMRLL